MGAHLDAVLGREADDREGENRHGVQGQGSPVGDVERTRHGTDHDEEDGTRPQDVAYHQHGLVHDVAKRDVVVDGHDVLVVFQ